MEIFNNGHHLSFYVRRCIAYCFLALGFFSGSAFASCGAVYSDPGIAYNSTTNSYSTAFAACTAMFSRMQKAIGGGVTFTLNSAVNGPSGSGIAYCYGTRSDSGSHTDHVTWNGVTCTDPVKLTCTNNAGKSYQYDNGMFSYKLNSYKDVQNVAIASFNNLNKVASCYNGCTISGDLKYAGCTGSGDSATCYVVAQSAKYTGNTCTPATSGTGVVTNSSTGDTLTSAPDGTSFPQLNSDGVPVCKPGTSPGQVNGVTVCAPSSITATGSSSSSSSSTSSTSSSGSTSSGSTGTSSTKSVVCDTVAMTCTTVTDSKTINSDGSKSTTSQTQQQTQQDYCKLDPSSAQCKGVTSSFSGDCNGGFTAQSDDAVVNALAQEVYKRGCIYNNDTDSSSSYNKAAFGMDTSDAAHLKAQSTGIGVGMFDQAGFGWSRSCPADPVIDLPNGQHFTMPFSSACGVLGALSDIGVAIALLVALMYVVK